MAEFLVRIEDRVTGNPTIDAANWKAGDVVGVYADGRCTEPPAPSTPFWIIKVPEITMEQANRFLEEHLNTERTLILRRKWKLDLTKIPVALYNKLVSDKWITISKAAEVTSFKAICYDKLNDKYGLT